MTEAIAYGATHCRLVIIVTVYFIVFFVKFLHSKITNYKSLYTVFLNLENQFMLRGAVARLWCLATKIKK